MRTINYYNFITICGDSFLLVEYILVIVRRQKTKGDIDMKKLTKTLISALCVAAIGASTGAFAGCGNADEGKRELTITGSTSVEPLMQKLAEAYEAKHDNVIINVGLGGSGVGITQAQTGENDFGMASRELKESETGVVSLKIAMDGIALIANKNCTVTDVTTAEVKALYEDGTPIQDTIKGALSRENGSGTRDAFHEIIGITKLYKGVGFEEGISQTAQVIANVKGNTAGNTVGYISMGSLTSDVNALKYMGVEATTANVSNGSYKLSRPFNIVYRQGSLSELAQDFIDFIMSADGQAIVTANNYIAVK